MASRNTGPGKPASDVTKIDPKTGRRVLMGMATAIPQHQRQTSGGIGVTLTPEQKTRLTKLSAPTGGSRRDWASLGDYMTEVTNANFETLEKIDVPRYGLTPYQQYIVACGHLGSSIHLGTGPTIGGVETPNSTGKGYSRDREAVRAALEPNGIVRTEAPGSRTGYTGPWLDAETKKPVQLVLVNAADVAQQEEQKEDAE